MVIEYLDPTLDIVFKMLMLKERSLLLDMVDAVLEPAFPIDEVVLLNPEIERGFPGNRLIAVDLRIRPRYGKAIDIALQSVNISPTRAQFTFYWAQCLAEMLKISNDYGATRDTASIVWLKEPQLEVPQFHSVFHWTSQGGEVPSYSFVLHILELSRLHLGPRVPSARLERWARFLRARSSEELENLAQEDPIMSKARETLERLSLEPDTRRIAEEREMALEARRK